MSAVPDVRARVDAVWDRLSPAERRVAAMVRHDPELLLVGTSAELAAESGTSKATVSRLVRSLGFQDAAEVRQELMSARGSGLPWAAEDAAHVDQRAVEARNLDAAFASLARADRVRLARRIVRARRVLVFGERGAHPVAMQLRSQLAQVRPDVRIGPAPGQRLGRRSPTSTGGTSSCSSPSGGTQRVPSGSCGTASRPVPTWSCSATRPRR